MKHLLSDDRPDGGQVNTSPMPAKPTEQPDEAVAPPEVQTMTAGKRPDAQKVEAQKQAVRDKPSGPVKAWAFSTLKNFETCPLSVYLSKVKKMPRVDSQAANRGNEAHDTAENYIRGEGAETPPPKILYKMAYDYLHLRRDFEARPEQFQLEENWGFTKFWQPTGFFDDDVWCRQKLDVFHLQSETSCRIIDHKTGRKFGNELKHADQGIQYAVGAFQKYPNLELASVEFWYLDHNQKLQRTYTRGQAMGLLARVEARAFAMTTATEDELQVAKPSLSNCKFCDHSKTGACPNSPYEPDPEHMI